MVKEKRVRGDLGLRRDLEKGHDWTTLMITIADLLRSRGQGQDHNNEEQTTELASGNGWGRERFWKPRKGIWKLR